MEFIIGTAEAGKRLDVALKSLLPEQSRGRIQKAIRDGFLWSDSRQLTDPASKATLGQRLAFELPDGQTAIAPSDGPLDVIWRDEHLAVCAKPPGLTVHPCPSCNEDTLANRLLAIFPELAKQEGERPGIVHRLDKDTSGLLLVALSEECRQKLATAFAEREIKKEYLALAAGNAPDSGGCAAPIGRHPALKTRMAIVAENHGGKPALTEWEKLWHNDRLSLLRVAIHTGRTHQIRVHLASQGLPIAGDKVYAPKAVAEMAPRQMLHAWRLEFAHPFTAEPLSFCLRPPADFFQTALASSEKMLPVVITGNQGCGKSAFCKALAALGEPTISADQIVADLYAGKSAATEWIESHLGDAAINADGSVNKPALFKILQERPWLRQELESAIHGLVLAKILQFWQENQDRPFAIAEIPLYFESDLSRHIPFKPFVVGVNCPEETRWQRIAANRGWSIDKIKTLERWQWPEKKKMAACDLVIDNSGSKEDLDRAAARFIEELAAKKRQDGKLLERELERLCA